MPNAQSRQQPRGRTSAGSALLFKELSEQASRRRTWIVRTIWTVGIFLAFGLANSQALVLMFRNDTSVLGRGGAMFHETVTLLLVGIYLLMPMHTAGVIAGEKERDTLSLLLLTELRPWQILLFKGMSRLVVACTFALPALPLLAVAYMLGGVGRGGLLAAAAILGGAAVQVIAAGLFCSSWCRTTSGAFLATYLLLAALYVGGILAVIPLQGVTGAFAFDPRGICPPWLLAAWMDVNFPLSSIAVARASVWSFASAAILLPAARLVLMRRHAVRGGSPIVAIFRRLDRLFHRANRIVGGIEVIRSERTLPGDRPVAWREVHCRGLARPHHLIRLLLGTTVPVLLLCAYAILYNPAIWWRMEGLAFLAGGLWMLTTAMVTVQAAGTFAAERRSGTLDVLLATPMTTAEILAEKTVAVRRLVLILAVPLLTAVGFEAWIEDETSFWWRRDESIGRYLFAAVGSILIYLPAIAWCGVWMGMRVGSYNRAVLASFGCIAAAVVLPPAIGAMLPESVGSIANAMSPGILLLTNELSRWGRYSHAPELLIAGNLGLWFVAAAWLRRRCYDRADRLLGRVAAEGEGPDATGTGQGRAGIESA